MVSSVENVTLNDAIADYYRVRRGRYSTTTWDAHEGALERWRTWITRETQPYVPLAVIAQPDERYMERYFNRLRPPMYEPRTFNNYRQYLKAFWDYCIAEGWVRTNPMRHVDPMRVPKKVRLQLSAAELLGLLDLATEPRDRIALAIGMNTALRAGDIAELRVGGANLTNDTLSAYVEKTDEERSIAITADLRVELLRWFDHYAREMGLESVADLPNDWRLVPPMKRVKVNMRKPELGDRIIYRPDGRLTHPERLVQKVLAAAGHETKKEGFHTIRRSTARVLFDRACADGVPDPIRRPMTLLGHKGRATTELYLGVTHEQQELDLMMRGQSFLHDALPPVPGVVDLPEKKEKGTRSA